jgi:hypothetical protein
VVFYEASRNMTWYIHGADRSTTSVLLPPALAGNATALAARLRGLLPRTRAMRAAVARHAMRLTYAWDELAEEDHEEVGPDAVDVALWAMTAHRDLGVPAPEWR